MGRETAKGHQLIAGNDHVWGEKKKQGEEKIKGVTGSCKLKKIASERKSEVDFKNICCANSNLVNIV